MFVSCRFIDDQEEKKETLVNFFIKNIHNKYNVHWTLRFLKSNVSRYNIYFFGFISMEILNVFIVLIQFAMTNTFLHYRFMGYGIYVSRSESWVNGSFAKRLVFEIVIFFYLYCKTVMLEF